MSVGDVAPGDDGRPFFGEDELHGQPQTNGTDTPRVARRPSAAAREPQEVPVVLEAQQAVVGSLLNGGAWADVAYLVRAEDYTPQHALILDAVGRLAANGEPHDPFAVSQELERHEHLKAAGGLAELSKFVREMAANTASTENLHFYAATVRRAALTRRLTLPAGHRDTEGIARLARDAAELASIDTARAARSSGLELLAFTPAQILAPIEPERMLLPGIPTEAYTLIAGALSSYKTTFLLNLILWRATGWDLLDLDPQGSGCDVGKCILATYEDTDRRIFAKLQRVTQHAYRMIRERDGDRDAQRFIERASANIRRIPLAGKVSAGIVRRVDGMIVPNTEFLESFIAQARAFAPEGALIGIDPLRLAIAGSQNDDDGADVVVHTLNRITLEVPGSGIAACSHATKANAQEPAEGKAGASYATSGSALFSQHARSNFLMARLKANEIRQLFDPAEVPNEDADGQAVVKLTHGRFSHGSERADVYLAMRDGILARVGPREAKSADQTAAAAALHIIPVVERLKAAGLRLSSKTLEADGPLVRAIGSVGKVREAVGLVLDAGYLESTGKTRDRDMVVTDAGRALLSVANHRESTEGAET